MVAHFWIVAALGVACGGDRVAVTAVVVLVSIILILGRGIDQSQRGRGNAGTA